MSRIKEYKIYNELIQKSVEILTLRLTKINDELKKLKDISENALQKYINEKGYGLMKHYNFPEYNKLEEEKIMKRSKITWNEKKSHHLYCPMGKQGKHNDK
ncbi:hypothetical protein PFDG_03900 [Plasmodium falciparum Dd2]|uniref:Uncharacterized protein n=1 Tax=Plasmodium falciparum (isolate Dd2) TaxID=57267 RepID=A0A0L7M4U0_PLAF4|nr:hypothetical protein PFDG_03900 [Plasmodium falciparum Dd2]